MEELANQFSLSKLSKNSPVFDYDKLHFLNGRAIQQRNSKELYNLLVEDGVFNSNSKFITIDERKKIALIELVKPRMKTLADFKEKFDIYLNGELNYDNSDFQKLKEIYSNKKIKKYLKLLLVQLETVESFDSAVVEECLRDCADRNGLKAADLIHPARFALTSETVSPSIFEVFAFFGKEESIRRVTRFIDYLEKLDA
jgi:glutamyl/glutaminyl-tRNA synthetase